MHRINLSKLMLICGKCVFVTCKKHTVPLKVLRIKTKLEGHLAKFSCRERKQTTAKGIILFAWQPGLNININRINKTATSFYINEYALIIVHFPLFIYIFKHSYFNQQIVQSVFTRNNTDKLTISKQLQFSYFLVNHIKCRHTWPKLGCFCANYPVVFICLK